MSYQDSVAIILVNYNGTKDTNECIKSLLTVEYEPLWIIVVDNGSPTKFILNKEFEDKKNIICLTSDCNLGFSGGNNLGIKYAIDILHIKYITLLNNDTVVEPDFLKKLMEVEERNSPCIVGGSIFYYFNKKLIWYAGGEYNRATGETIHIGFNDTHFSDDKNEKEVTFITGCLMLFSSSVVEKIGCLPEEEFLYYEDTDYCCKALDSGIKLIYAPEAVIYHKVSASTKHKSTLQNYYMIRNGLYIINKYGKKKRLAYVAFIKKYIKALLKNECTIGILLAAISDFKRGKMGKMVV